MRIYSPIINDSAEISGSLKVTGSANFEYNVTVTGSLVAPSITGSLFGTSSWANNAISSSYAQTASFVLNAISSSFASTASYVNPLRQDVQISGSLRVTGSGNHYIVGGNIGINKINPTNPLDVVGTTFISGALYTRGQGIFINSNDNIGSTQLQVTYGYAPGEFLIKPSGSNSQFLFSPNGGVNIGASDGWNIAGSPGSPPERGLAVSGSVGIGTRQPTQKLHVSGGSVLIDGGNFLYFRDTTTKIYEGSGLTLDSGVASRPIKIQAGGSDLVFISGSGNVGFGTSTPIEKIHVIGNITGSGTLGIRNRTTLWGDVELYGGNNNNSIALTYLYTGSLLGKSNVLHFRQGGSTAGAIMFTYYGTNPMLTMIPSDFSSARVGINTPNPQATLHVSGSSGSVVFEVDSDSSPNIIYASGSGNVGFGTATPGVKVDVVGQIRSNSTIFSSETQTQKIRINSATQLTFENTGSVEIARVTNAGNWGFGTSTPTEKVHVVGNGLFTGDLTVQGKITAEEFHTEFVSASIIYKSGSTKFGDTSDDTHQFTGSLQAPSITGSLFGTASYALQTLSASYAVTASHALNVSVRTEGSSLYSYDPSTSNFSQVDGVFLGTNAGSNASAADGAVMLGIDAGQGATNSDYSVMIGASAGSGAPNTTNAIFIGTSAGFSASNAQYGIFSGVQSGYEATNAKYGVFNGFQAGYNATNASQSVFIGYDAGVSATDANDSVFAGYQAGSGAPSASYSVIIGRRAGYSNNIGRNNILIGTGVTLPVNSQNRLNIAGLIFGSGSYFDSINTSSGSANGRVGINQPNPQYSFDVSGSGNYTNNLYVTGGLLVTRSYISTVDYIDFTLTANPPHNEGRIHWIDDTKTLNVDTDVNNFYIELGHQNVVRVNNQNSFTLTKGAVVYINGENGQRPTIATASWTDDSLSATTLGFVAQDINSGQNGYVVTRGIIRDINTNAYSPGTMLYLSSSGQYTSTIPLSPLHEVRLGRTITQAVAGTIYVDIMNGYEIGELHDVLETDRQNGDLIVFDSGSRVYKNSKILSGSYGVSGSLNVSQGITGSLLGTSSYAVQSLSASLAESASYYPIKVSGSTIYSADPATSGFNTTGAVIIGPNSVGQNSTNSQFAVMVGAAAGQNATTSQYAVMIGTSAGNGASNSEYAVMLGRWAGTSATNASSSVMVGREAGRNATNTTLSTFVGSYAGFGATNARNSTFIGNQAGYNASSANDSVFVGANAGYGATAAVQSLFYGPNAGFQASAATLSTFIGNESGYNAISASYGVFIGNLSGQNATSASFSTFIGRQAGQAATKASSATFIGGVAGYAATFANNGVFIGNSAGESAASASYSILIGNNAGATSNAANTIGSYNTVIGTGISVPVNATRTLNIGGLIFGTGSYASANLDAFSGSANGRVGINQPLPQKEFDVSGSVRISRLSTSLTAPATTGTTKMVITDQNGDLSFSDVPTLQVTYITGSASQLRIDSGSISRYYRISTTGTFEVAIDTNSSKPGIPTGSQIIIEKLITGSVTISTSAGVGYTGSLYIPYQYQTLTLTKVNTDEWVGVGGYDNQLITFNSQSSTTYTLVKEDIGEMIRLNNASPITVTIPPNSSQAFPIGAIVSLEQQGAGVVTCITGSGVTINSTARKTWGQYSVIQVYKVGTDVWNVIGGVE